jgi:gamma-glutamyltranspeptidase
LKQPVTSSYRGYEIITTLPASGGACLAGTLRVLEHDEIGAMGLNTD